MADYSWSRAYDDETIMILDGVFHVMYSATFDNQYAQFLG